MIRITVQAILYINPFLSLRHIYIYIYILHDNVCSRSPFKTLLLEIVLFMIILSLHVILFCDS